MKKTLILVFFIAIIAAAPQNISASSSAKVVATDYQFSPSTVTVRKNTRVTWIFKEGIHNVRGKGWGSSIKSSGSYTHNFKKSGKYPYVCTIHPGMNGKVIVK